MAYLLRLQANTHIIMKLVIGDFGCGRAKLAELLKENEMYNFDQHDIISDKITVCDMKSVPLKYGQLDIAVFCLSLMEENWPDYIIEAEMSCEEWTVIYCGDDDDEVA